jgi:hypothetical protein
MKVKSLQKYQLSSDKALKWLDAHLTTTGHYGQNISDLACYYKSPYLFYLAGRTETANIILNHVKTHFLLENGDFTTTNELKSENAAFTEYWAYTNAWLAIAAQKMGRFDVAYPAYQYLKTFYHPRYGGFTTHRPYNQSDNILDVLTTAHLGLTALYFGDLEIAQNAGHLLNTCYARQSIKLTQFYLRLDNYNQIIAGFSPEAAIFYSVDATQPNQAYFMIGYPIAFLGKLYQATGDIDYLSGAENYLNFALHCHDHIRAFHFSHKVAWGAAVVANLTNNMKYLELCQDIVDYLVDIQSESGAWLADEPAHICFDQTAEIAIWLREINAELATISTK